MAAGLGFKTFTTGEVLTAADTNGYLMQGVLVFASAAARDAAITSPQEGQTCYLKDTDAVLTYSGSAWVEVGGSVPTSYGLSAGKNPILNSAFQVWQRGTSFTATSVYTADRWYRDGNSGRTFSRQITNDTTNLPFIQYCLRAQRDSGNTSTNVIQIGQSLESVNSIPYAGRTVTFSFYARAGANYSAASSALAFSVRTGTGTDQNLFSGYTGQALPINSSATLTTTWQRFSATATLSASATELGVLFEFTPVGTAGANDFFEVTGIQLEAGSTATAFQTATGTIQAELAVCQRYFQREADDQKSIGAGAYFSTTDAFIPYFLKTTMRIAPTVTFDSTGAVTVYDAGAARLSTAVAADAISPRVVEIKATTGATTAGRGIFARITGSGNFINFSAEL